MIEVDEGVRRPELFLQFFACDHLAGALEEHRQKQKGLPLQLYSRTIAAQLTCPEINR